MSRDWFINGESMVSVKGNVNTLMPLLTQLGLSDGPIRITPNVRHRDLNLDAYGSDVPPDTQMFLADAIVSMTLVHYDAAILSACIIESFAGAGVPLGVGIEGLLPRAGQRMGGGFPRFAAGNHYIGLNILSPVAGVPYRFLYAYLTGPPVVIPLGTEKSLVQVNWRVLPYAQDPWNNGLGAQGQPLYDHTLDT